MSKILFHISLIAPVPNEGVDFGTKKWAKHSKKRIYKMKRGVNQVGTKIGNLIANIEPSFVPKMMQATSENYLRGVRKAFRPKKGESKVQKGITAEMSDYERIRREYYYPFYGSTKDNVKGLIFLAIMALTGDKQLVKYVKPDRDRIIEGEPILITSLDRLPNFRNMLKSMIAKLGWLIYDSGFKDNDIKTCNETLNRLVNSYTLPEFQPFTSGGASHIDFEVVEGTGAKRLCLDIRVVSKETTD